MPHFSNILRNMHQRVRAFLFSWDALIFCFFCMLSAGMWLVRSINSAPAQQQTAAEGTAASNTIVYTEKTLTVPIKATNTPPNEQLITFPDVVTVTARVTLEKYNSLSASSFSAECIYPTSEVEKLPIEVSCQLADVASFRFQPHEAEFIIHAAEEVE